MKKPQATLSETRPIRIGKDEMNFVENPIALLTDRPDPNQKTLIFTQPYLGKDGKAREAQWVVTGSDQYGLPLAGDEDIFLVLMELTKEQGFKDRNVEFSRYEIVRRLKGSNWAPSGADYERIQAALDRLVGVTIYADRWYDRAKKSYGAYRFHILEKVVLHDEPPGRKRPMQTPFRLSSITWDETVFRSFQHGYIKNLDLERYFLLRSPIARRLYRFLDKRFYDGKPRFEIHLRLLAHEHLGISRNYSYDSQIKVKMKKAHEEMVGAECISGYDFRNGQEGAVVIYYPPKRSAGKPLLPTNPETESPEAALSEEEKRKALPSDAPASPLCGDLVAAGISPDTAKQLVETCPEERIRQKLAYLPYVSPKNPGGWLRRAIEEDWQPPAGYLKARREEERRREQAEAAAWTVQKKEEQEKTSQEREARFRAALAGLSGEEREVLQLQAEAAARERHPQAAATADRGKGQKIWSKFVERELEKLTLRE